MTQLQHWLNDAVRNDKQGKQPPSVAELAEYIMGAPDAALDDLESRLTDIHTPMQLSDIKREADAGIAIAFAHTFLALQRNGLPTTPMRWEWTDWLEFVHAAWKKYGKGAGLPSPIAPIVRAWLARPREVLPSARDTFPYGAVQRDSQSNANKDRYPLPAHIALPAQRRQPNRQMVLAGFEVGRQGDEIYLPEEFYRIAEREGARKGHIALAQRALVFALLKTPVEAAASPTGYAFDVSGREYIRVTHGANKTLPRPSVWLSHIRNTREELARVEIPFTNKNGRTSRFTPVAIFRTPDNPGDDIRFVTQLPEAYGALGVRIDADSLWASTSRANDFYLLLSLPFHFERVGVTAVPKGDGILFKTDIEAYPEITQQAIVDMASPFSAQRTKQNLREKAFHILESLAERTGAFQVAVKGNTRIALPPQANFTKSAKRLGFAIIRKQNK